MRFLALLLAVTLAGCASQRAPLTSAAPPSSESSSGRMSGPPGKSPYECYTDDGYGRYRPCGDVQ